jgi:hypothetical protein
MDPAIFFPDDRDGEKRAIAICMSCPVQDECMEHAITANEDDGVWGGTTPKHRDEIVWERGEDERRKARKRKSRERKPL